MRGPKVCVIGAGSYFFGKPVIHKMATSDVFAGGTLAFVDTDEKVLKTMMKLGRRVFKETKAPVKLVGSTNRKEVMKDSDFVVLTFSEQNARFRGIDTEIALKHGITMCSSDTIGPGGIFRAMREIPQALDMCRDAAKFCPNAWVINFVNPTAVLGIALQRYAEGVRTFALCDGNHEPMNTVNFCKRAGILPEDATCVPPEVWARLDLRIGGVNHCTWVVKFDYDGKDMLPALRRWLEGKKKEEAKNPKEKSKPRYNFHYAAQLFDLYGAYPTAISHTKEYVPFFQGLGVKPNRPEPIRPFDAELRSNEMANAWGVTEEYASGKRTVKEFMQKLHNDHATDIIEGMWGGLGKQFYINTRNGGSVTNLPGDAVLELRCDIDMRGPRPHPFGPMPRGVLGLQQQVLDVHEMTAEAAVTGDRRLVERALAADPLCNNIADAKACVKDLLAAEKDVLPDYWFSRKKRR